MMLLHHETGLPVLQTLLAVGIPAWIAIGIDKLRQWWRTRKED